MVVEHHWVVDHDFGVVKDLLEVKDISKVYFADGGFQNSVTINCKGTF
jgi:hypothetical protein